MVRRRAPLCRTCRAPCADCRARMCAVSGAKHMVHMGIMLLALLGFGGYYLWDSIYGSGALKVMTHAAVRAVGVTTVETEGPDGRM